jgi:hypothetical protein
MLAALLFALPSVAQVDSSPKDASAAVVQAFQTHNIVMLGEIHRNTHGSNRWLLTLSSPIGLTTS